VDDTADEVRWTYDLTLRNKGKQSAELIHGFATVVLGSVRRSPDQVIGRRAIASGETYRVPHTVIVRRAELADPQALMVKWQMGMLPDIALAAAAQGEYSHASRRASAPGSLYRLGGLAMLVMFTAKYPASSVKRDRGVQFPRNAQTLGCWQGGVDVRSRQSQRVYQLSALRRGPA
jgi:hypothetical protein